MKSKNWAKILGVVVLLAVTVAVAAEVTKPVCGTWRYKLTVNVDTPEGMKSGSAVREVEVCRVERLVPEMADAKTKVKGEAVVVDLGHRGVLFGIMDTDGSYQVVFDAFPGPPGFTEEGIKYYSNLKNAKQTLEPGPLQNPTLVKFGDLRDPKTVEVFYAQKNPNENGLGNIPQRDLEDAFGEGVKLRDITIEMTDEPITWGIEKWLPWLPGRKNVMGYLGGSPDKPSDDPTKTYFNGIEFSRGSFW